MLCIYNYILYLDLWTYGHMCIHIYIQYIYSWIYIFICGWMCIYIWICDYDTVNNWWTIGILWGEFINLPWYIWPIWFEDSPTLLMVIFHSCVKLPDDIWWNIIGWLFYMISYGWSRSQIITTSLRRHSRLMDSKGMIVIIQM